MQNKPTDNNLSGCTAEQNATETSSRDNIAADLSRRYDDYMRNYHVETASQRQSCLTALRQLSVSRVEAEYSGYGDSGQVDDVTLEPVVDRMPDGLAEQLDDLVWRVASQTNQGLEINDGARGEFHWSIADDCITINHCSYYTAEEHSRHEGL